MNYLKDEKFKKALEVLKKEFQPTSTYLFGSRANGTETKTSDYDILLIVENSNLNRLERVQKAHVDLFNAQIYIPMDIFIYTREEFNKQKLEFDTIPEIVTHEGTELDLAAI